MLRTTLVVLTGLLAALSVSASPVPYPFDKIQELARSKIELDRSRGIDIEKRLHDKRHKLAVPATAPHFTVYSDQWLDSGAPPAANLLAGWNTFALCFHQGPTGPFDMVQGWIDLPQDQKDSIKADYAAAGVNLIAAVYGANPTPTTSGDDPTTWAQNFAQFVKDNGLDGVDVDYEDSPAFEAGTAEAWLITFQKELRAQLPSPDYIISHAPQAPYFTTNGAYPSGGYTKVHQEVGDGIDFYNVQFYNQGEGTYSTCDELITKSTLAPAGTALLEIVGQGIPADKVVLGKPASATGDANNGYIDPQTLHGCVETAKGSGWNGGLMVWQWPHGDSNTWVGTVWG